MPDGLFQDPVSLLIVIAIVILSISLWIRYRTRSRIRRQLKKMISRSRTNQADTQFKISLVALLRRYFDVPYLNAEQSPAGIDGEEWKSTINQLNRLRYAPPSEEAQNILPQVLDRISNWIH